MKNIVYQTKTNQKVIGIILLGITLNSFLILLIISQVQQNYNGLYWCIVSFFGLFTLYLMWQLLNLKKIILTEHQLIINEGLIFKDVIYNFYEIKTLKEEHYKLEPSIGNFNSKFPIHEGKKITVELNSNKTLVFTSLETKDFYTFSEVFKSLYYKNLKMKNK